VTTFWKLGTTNDKKLVQTPKIDVGTGQQTCAAGNAGLVHEDLIFTESGRGNAAALAFFLVPVNRGQRRGIARALYLMWTYEKQRALPGPLVFFVSP
jgi:hypothetical protein